MTSTTTAAPTVEQIPVKLIQPDPTNPREEVGDVTGLAESIGLVGLLQPITVRQDGKGYVVQFGHRRLAAVKQLGLKTIDAIVRDQNGLAMAAATAENVARVQLGPLEEARAFRAMIDGGMTTKGVAEATGQTENLVKARLVLLELPEAGQRAVETGKLPMLAVPTVVTVTRNVHPDLAAAYCEAILNGQVRPDTIGLSNVIRGLTSGEPAVCTAPGCDNGKLYDDQPEYPADDAPDEEWEAVDNWEPPDCPVCKGSGQAPDQGDTAPPEWVCLTRHIGYNLDNVYWLTDELREKLNGIVSSAPYRFDVKFSTDTMDQAVAGGFGFQVESDNGKQVFLTDVAFASDRIALDVETEVEQIKKSYRSGSSGGGGGTEDGKAKRPISRERIAGKLIEPEKDETQAGYSKRVRALARQHNTRLAEKLTVKLDSVPVTKDAILLLAGLVFDHIDSAPGFARLIRQEWQTSETTTRGEKITYPDGHQALEQMWAWIGRATDPEQMLGRVVQVLVAVGYADQKEVVKSQRVYGHGLPYEAYREKGDKRPATRKLLAKVAKPAIGSMQPNGEV